MTEPEQSYPRFSVNVPSPARMYDYGLGGKDNFAVDREANLAGLARFPELLDIARENRLFLYRVVRFLAGEAGIRQFLDMGSGLPTAQNVHQVAQQFQPDARVVYVDNDPVVLTHGRALLAEQGRTTVVMADMTRPHEILAHADVRRLIDFGKPVAVLFLSVLHSIPDDTVGVGMLTATADALAAGSFVALSQCVGESREAADEHNQVASQVGLAWKTRMAEDIREYVGQLEQHARGLELVPPGLVDVAEWRPDRFQPPLAPVDVPLRPFLGAAARHKRLKEFGGVLRLS
jgi:hypothetical protein